ncbi:hypothetical protein BVC93_11880 [Mycobacterium sp. MS1601]|nr:hypothetical protein BVC93_11880 [Mycobacterium sp. MS1601]
MPSKYDDEFKARAVRLVTDHAKEYTTRTACIIAVAKRWACPTNRCVAGSTRPRLIPASETECRPMTARALRELKRKNREPEETIEILKAAASFFARDGDLRHR